MLCLQVFEKQHSKWKLTHHYRCSAWVGLTNRWSQPLAGSNVRPLESIAETQPKTPADRLLEPVSDDFPVLHAMDYALSLFSKSQRTNWIDHGGRDFTSAGDSI
jgi:hypothetical protein